MNRKEVLEQFRQGFDCSQVVLMAFAEELGYDEEELARVASAFGGGMMHGDTCGAFSGALMALGMQFGHDSANEFEKKAEISRKASEFRQAFVSRCGSPYCRDLISHDVAIPGEFQKALDEGIVMDRCPGYCLTAIEEVKRLLED